MPKTKKTKGASKAKENETEAERKTRLEMEALQAEENERRKQEAARVALRERQLREQAYAKLNSIKIHNQWRKIMRMAKVEELRHEIEVLSQNHEREVDRKDAIVQMLDRDLEEAEEQYCTAVRAHMQVMDSLLDLQYTRMKALEAEFAADLRTLEEEFDAERTEVMNSHVRQKKDMADMLAAMEQEFADAENELKQEFEAQREEIKNRNSEDYNVLKIQLEGIIEELERHFEQAHKAYLETTEHRTSAFKQLTRNDAQAARVIEKRMRKLVKLQQALTHWRTKIATNSREWEDRNRALRNEKEIMSRHYAHLKSGMDSFRAAQGERLKTLTLSSNAAIKALEKKLSLSESVLQLGELCRKFETEQEKVLPFMIPPLVEEAYTEEEADLTAQQQKEGLKQGDQRDAASPSTGPRLSAAVLGPDGEPVTEWEALNGFFRRYNKAALDKAAVDKEKARLEKENADLRSILKQYLDGISVNDDVMNNPVNPLLVVNNRLQVTLQERNKARQQANALRNGAPSALGAVVQPGQLVIVNAVSHV